VIGVFLFFVEVIILCWAKFWEMGQPLGQPGKLAALVSTIVFCPFLIAFLAFAVYFYSKLADHKYESTSLQIKELEQMLQSIESANKRPNYDLHDTQGTAQRTRQQRFASYPNQSAAFFIDISQSGPDKRKRQSVDCNYAYFNPAYLPVE
jgi:uncharacterized membrane protein